MDKLIKVSGIYKTILEKYNPADETIKQCLRQVRTEIHKRMELDSEMLLKGQKDGYDIGNVHLYCMKTFEILNLMAAHGLQEVYHFVTVHPSLEPKPFFYISKFNVLEIDIEEFMPAYQKLSGMNALIHKHFEEIYERIRNKIEGHDLDYKVLSDTRTVHLKNVGAMETSTLTLSRGAGFTTLNTKLTNHIEKVKKLNNEIYDAYCVAILYYEAEMTKSTH